MDETANTKRPSDETKTRNVTDTADAIAKMRIKLAQVLHEKHDDNFLKRYLDAHGANIENASNAVIKTLDWRAFVKADEILEQYTPSQLLQNYFMGGIVGKDKDGAVLIVQKYGKMDFKGLMQSVSQEELIKHHVYLCEQIYNEYYKNPDNVGKWTEVATSVIDFEGFSLRNFYRPGFKLFTELISIVETHYPGMTNKALIVNTPKYFHIGYSLISPFLSEETQQKTKIYGANYQEELLRYIDAEELPLHYGGTKTGDSSDPHCSRMIAQCGIVPTSYYKQLDATNSTEAFIQKSIPVYIEVDVLRPQSLLWWQVTTGNHEVLFSVKLKQQSDPPKDIRPSEKIISHLVPVTGSLTCETPGTYMVCFEMPPSTWARKRRIFYTVDILENISAHDLGLYTWEDKDTEKNTKADHAVDSTNLNEPTS